MVGEALLASWRDTPTWPSAIDGPEKPVGIWSRMSVSPPETNVSPSTWRRPLDAGGNSNGEVPMLRFARVAERDAMSLHDPEREFECVAAFEDARERAKDKSWTVVSIKRDWAQVFPEN